MKLPPNWHRVGTIVYRRSDGCEVLKSNWYSERIGSWRVWFAGHLIHHLNQGRRGHVRGWQTYTGAMRWADKNIPLALEEPNIERT